MKVIFLDIDGVLVNQQFQKDIAQHCIPLSWRYKVFSQEAILNLCDIIWATGAYIVLSSSWRYDEERAHAVQKQLTPYNLKLIGMTTMNGDFTEEDRIFWRGCEIRQWLQEHPEVDKYIVLDDDNDMLPEQQEHLVLCDWNTGLTHELAQQAIKLLA